MCRSVIAFALLILPTFVRHACAMESSTPQSPVPPGPSILPETAARADGASTVIRFSRKGRWRWWMMAAVGLALTLYGLAILTSPAWSRFGVFGHNPFWIWFRGELYLIVGFIQFIVGAGYLRLTHGPEVAVRADPEHIVVRRLFYEQSLRWDDVKRVHTGRSSVLLAAGPISWWRLVTFDPRLLRLDTTVLDGDIAKLKGLVGDRLGARRSNSVHNDNPRT